MGLLVKLGPADAASSNSVSSDAASSSAASASVPRARVAASPRLQFASLAADSKVAVARVSAAVADITAAPLPPPPPVAVTFVNGQLHIHADKATLAQVLFEIQRQTQAEIAIPAGAEQEQVITDIGPGPAQVVLASLLNGSNYNFIFVGSDLILERVILTRRDPNIF